MKLQRRKATVSILIALTTGLAPLTYVGAASAQEPSHPAPRVVPAMTRMHQLMITGNPGMARMHQLMITGNPGLARMHQMMLPGSG